MLGLLVACGGPPDAPIAAPPMPESRGSAVALSSDPARWFDFWLGSWDVQNLHLRHNGTFKETGTAVATIQAVAGGNAVLEQWSGRARGSLIGSSIRGWDPENQRWDVYLNWHTGKPIGFDLMYGERVGEALHLYPSPGSGSPRYTFSKARTDQCQWSLESDIGQGRWRTDWVMQFVRSAAPTPANARTVTSKTPPERAARFPETRRLDHLIGTWRGETRHVAPDGSWQTAPATAVITSLIEGFALAQFIDTSLGREYFAAMAFDSRVGGWLSIRSDCDKLGLERLVGSHSGSTVTFASRNARETWSLVEESAAYWKLEKDEGPNGMKTVAEGRFERAR